MSMPLFGGRRSMSEVQNQALIKTARELAERIDELERELQSAASQIGQLQRELQTERTGRLERDLQAVQDRTGKLERDFQAAQGRTDIERDLQQARNEVERLTLERDFYSNKASALEEENRELTESATKYSLHAQKLERELTWRPSTPCGAKGWNANSTGLIQMVRPTAGSERKAKIGLHHTKEMDVF
jgi:chromosome segregation ATPase